MPELLKSFAWDTFVLFFYAQVVGLHGGLIGMAIAIIIAFDTIVDPWIGALSDRLQSARFGRRHSLMFAAILPYMVGIALVFSPPQGMSQMMILSWLLGFGLLARCGISFWTVPSYAMGGELSRDADERRLIAVLRNVGNQLVILVVPIVAFGLFFVQSGAFPKPQLDPAPYPLFGLFVSFLGGALMLVGGIGTYRRARIIERTNAPEMVVAADNRGASLFGAFLHAIRITPNIGRLLLVAFLVLFTSSLVNQMSLHLATYFWELDATWTPRLLIAGILGSLLAMALAPAFTRAIGSRRAMMAGLCGYFLVQACAIILPLAGLSPAAGTAAIGAFIFCCRFAGGICYALYVVPFNIVTYDIGDEHEANTGRPAQGIVASFMFIGLQVGGGVVALLAGSFLGLIDFPTQLPVDQMPGDKVAALAWFVLSLIVVAGGAMAWLVGTFRIDHGKRPAIVG
ncbi:sugar transporter [Sphingobium lactosutens]|uniref:MFS transporter n=1 Tax=Sphingobium lactosutens TaxID=522773 RepID=UPI0015B837E5|nr:MFS transporter [Sphingobium lactosutens]NWK98703.1 sugar transporter [Sphingobium lactosutens]